MSQNYGLYQTEIYRKAAMTGSLPIVTTDPTQLQAEAKKTLSSKAYNYVAGGAGEHATMDANRLAFRQWKL
jgi:lactate 2-monooxygenase